MCKRKIPVDLSCPLRLTLSLIDSKWESCILDELRHTSMRPCEQHQDIFENKCSGQLSLTITPSQLQY